MLAPVAQALELSVTLSKVSPEGVWQVDYAFSEQVSELSFERTPYAFVESAWKVKSEWAVLKLSSLTVLLDSPGKVLSTEIQGPYDQMIRGFYTPFLSFSDGSSALFIAHYFPSKVMLGGKWVAIDSIAKRLTIVAPESGKLWFAEGGKIKDREFTIEGLQQYAYIGSLEIQHQDQFDLILDPKLPKWVKGAYDKATRELLTYYQSRTNTSLSFRPLFLINFKPGSGRPRIDGGAINQQVAINIVGDGWHQNPEQNLINVLSLIAHEMAHLWNTQYWISTKATPIWMLEGGANYFAQKALLNLGYIAAADYEDNVRKQTDACGRILALHPFDRLPNRLDYYTCGEALYYLGDAMLGNPQGLKLWNLIVEPRLGSSYTQQDFIQALVKAKVSSKDIGVLSTILAGKNHGFDALAQKYLLDAP